MNNRSCCRLLPWRSASVTAAVLLAALAAAAPCAEAAAPEWLRALTRVPMPAVSEETMAVVLLDEQITTVSDNGEIKTVYRKAYKILRPKGRELGFIRVYYDNETKLTFLKAWSLPPAGKEFEVKEKDAVDFSFTGSSLYEDTRYKSLRIPAAEPGHIIGYEYEQKRRPFVYQDKWWFQDELPVARARFQLQLPRGWEFSSSWLNHDGVEPQKMGENQWVWELENVPEVHIEVAMPPWRAVAGRLALTYFPTREQLRGKSHGSWGAVGKWYSELASGRLGSSAEIRQKVAELTAKQETLAGKLGALAAFAQRDIRYVAIEVGIGGYQPHAATDVFTNRYGDCKDKATLLSTMLREIGVESHYVLIHTRRGVVDPEFPSMLNFNHVVLAIRLPESAKEPHLFAVQKHETLGDVLYFDPTDSFTPIGQIPASLQSSHGLLVLPGGGELVRLPLLPPAVNRLLRVGKLTLSPTGALSGEVQEIRWGSPAVSRRAQLLDMAAADRRKVLESFLAGFLTGVTITEIEVENLENHSENLVVRYRFVAQNYAKVTGNLLLLRPRVLGAKGDDILERKERKYPIEFDDATLQSDLYEIRLPAGFVIDELPPPAEVDTGFAKYESKTQVEGGVLRYTRTYQIQDVRVPVERLEDLKKFYRRVASDERNSAVLKRAN